MVVLLLEVLIVVVLVVVLEVVGVIEVGVLELVREKRLVVVLALEFSLYTDPPYLIKRRPL